MQHALCFWLVSQDRWSAWMNDRVAFACLQPCLDHKVAQIKIDIWSGYMQPHKHVVCLFVAQRLMWQCIILSISKVCYFFLKPKTYIVRLTLGQIDHRQRPLVNVMLVLKIDGFNMCSAGHILPVECEVRSYAGQDHPQHKNDDRDRFDHCLLCLWCKHDSQDGCHQFLDEIGDHDHSRVPRRRFWFLLLTVFVFNVVVVVVVFHTLMNERRFIVGGVDIVECWRWRNDLKVIIRLEHKRRQSLEYSAGRCCNEIKTYRRFLWTPRSAVAAGGWSHVERKMVGCNHAETLRRTDPAAVIMWNSSFRSL